MENEERIRKGRAEMERKRSDARSEIQRRRGKEEPQSVVITRIKVPFGDIFMFTFAVSLSLLPIAILLGMFWSGIAVFFGLAAGR